MGDGKVVDGVVISGTVIYDMVVSRRCDIRYGRMTSSVVVTGAITSDIMGTRRGDIGDDDEVTYGIVVSIGRNTGDSRAVSDMTCSKREGLGEGDGRGEGESVEALGANGVDDVDGANMVLGGCIDR